MKTFFLIIRILAIFFYSYLYFKLHFDLASCLIGYAFLLVITHHIKTKKSEAPTSDL